MNLDEARRQASALFGPIEPPGSPHLVELGRRDGDAADFIEQLQSMTPNGFPLPVLLLFGLTQLLGLQDYGPEEKVACRVRFGVRGATFGFELRKFGLRMLCEPTNIEKPITREILGKARALTDIAEQYLSDSYAIEQIYAGHFTIENLYMQLDGRYRFLRAEAESAYAKPPPPPREVKCEHGVYYEHDVDRPAREGGALGTATVDAYFSRLEHLICLSAAFLEDALPSGGILDFLAANWPSKLRAVLDIRVPAAKSFYDRLLAVREEWRNPIAHGGFLTGGGSLYFHVPGVGALPARMRRTPEGVRLGFQMEGASFQVLMQLFDAFDAFLKSGPLKFPYQWAEAGLDVAFDSISRDRYIRAMRSDADFASFIEGTERAIDRDMNMEF